MLRERLLTNVKNSMIISDMSAEDISRVCMVLVSELSKYEISERCTEVGFVDRSTESLLKMYAGTLLTEGKSRRTVNEYVKLIRRFSDEIDVPLIEVGVFDVRVWLAKLQQTVSLRTCENYRSYISAFYQWMQIEELIEKNPVMKIKPISYDVKVRKAFTDIEVDRLRSGCQNERERAEMELLLSSGVRLKELSSLDIKDVSFEDNSVIVRNAKGNKQRKTYMSNVCREHLICYLKSRTDKDPSLFIGRTGKRLSKRTLAYDMERIGRRSGVDDVHPHRFRRTFAVNLLRRDVDIRTIQMLMGHSSLQTTQEYLQVDDSHIVHEYFKTA